MFIQNLNQKQQSVLLDLCEQVIRIDGIVDEKEKEMLAVLHSQCMRGVEPLHIEKKEITKLFDSSLSKVSLMLEMLGIAYANDDYHPEQAKLITEYANVLGITEGKMIELEDWIKKQFSLFKEVQKFFD